MLNELEEFKRYLERMKYRAEAEALEAYLGRVSEARISFDDSVSTFYRHHGEVASDWSGKAREAYESLIMELEQTERNVIVVHGELINEINAEIERLLQKAEAMNE